MRIAFTHNLQSGAGEHEAEFDSPETVAMLEAGLRRAGHEVALVEVSRPLKDIIAALEEAQPDLVFNTAEGVRGRFREAFLPALFEQMELPYVGSDPYVCAVTLDKSVTKQIVAANGVPTPSSQLVTAIEDLAVDALRFPVIAKPNSEGSSMGISADSVVEGADALLELVGRVLEHFPDGVLVEEYIEGTDVVVPFVAGASPQTAGVFEPASYAYQGSFAERKYRIFDGSLKKLGYEALRITCPAEVSSSTRDRIMELSRRAYRALGIRDFGRIDFRVAADGTPFFLEVNALPSLEKGASIYLCGERVGVVGVDAVLEAIIAHAAARYGIA